MTPTVEGRPRLPEDSVLQALREHFGLTGALSPLPGEWDQNFRLDAGGRGAFVVKLANTGHDQGVLDFQNAALAHLSETEMAERVPRWIPSTAGGPMAAFTDGEGTRQRMRVLTWLQGEPLSRRLPLRSQDLQAIGSELGRLDLALETFTHPSMDRDLFWDIRRAGWISSWTHLIEERGRRDLVERILLDFRGRIEPELDLLPAQVIHNDANDANILMGPATGEGAGVAGFLDFGDMVLTQRIHELAIAAAYAVVGGRKVATELEALAEGYVQGRPLLEEEIRLLPSLVRVRLCVSAVNAARAAGEDPGNAHRQTSASAVWTLLEVLGSWPGLEEDASWNGTARRLGLRGSVLRPPGPAREDLMKRRKASLGPSLSLSYEQPLVIRRGRGARLLDDAGRPYLDCVNNVCHVGHGHPRVVEAMASQAAELNTNTRYLHGAILDYAERLAGTFPDPLDVCFFVNSGSEANDLALRMARAHTGRREAVTVDHAYHGHTQALIEISPYKCEGRGGAGLPGWVRKVPAPDPYRGRHRGPDSGPAYADEVRRTLDQMAREGRPPALFIAESFQGCGGQIVPPDGFLKGAFEAIRQAGGVAIADEVQVGMGRVGSHWWAFQPQGALPDIVTLGKPLGNGHPLAAVVTTLDIARSFHNGMEYFNTFGGNPVSMAVGLAVMDVMEDERLMENAERVGGILLDGFRRMQRLHPRLGDVRGRGLFVGLELVESPKTRVPAPGLAKRIVQSALRDGILLSIDGPEENVIKIKPPLVFSGADARALLWAVERALHEAGHGALLEGSGSEG